ncbi:MAG: hypothetical protein GY862_28175 [Gammaproteobacteria bacterium]|nr:hypothetical protein [Gammaproteobacteria bacterium]
MLKPKRPDPITNPHDFGSGIAEAIYHALRPVDAIAKDMESKWGIDRLASLVDPSLGARFGKAKAQLDEAIMEHNADLVIAYAGAMIRGWQALDAAATAAGASPVADVAVAWSWRHPESNQPYVITRDNATSGAVRKFDGTARIYTLDEVCRIIASVEDKSNDVVGTVKDLFPGAEVVELRNSVEDDALPF